MTEKAAVEVLEQERAQVATYARDLSDIKPDYWMKKQKRLYDALGIAIDILKERMK